MKVGIVSDHRGYDLKSKLIKELSNYQIIDYGTNTKDSVDYPDYAFLLGNKINTKEIDFGIAICGSGIGISIACNKVKGIRCAKVNTVEDAKVTRLDNDANVVALSADTQLEDAKNIIKTFLTTDFSNEERHIKRIHKIAMYEDKHYDR